jgi:HD-GYP domain-containing protein (c-di-GMP phosphodiesterase class II)
MIIEMRDPYTAGHQRRVTQLSCAIAAKMGLPQEQIDMLDLAGQIHDIGKVRIPAEILSRPKGLSSAELAIIRTHPFAGYEILKTIESTGKIAAIVYQHHERMDGSGYPSGLAGDEILMEARILAVADVVEAMASHRPYRSALGLDKALEEISRHRGRLYDAEVVAACLELFYEREFAFDFES